ncbi:MAG: NAD-dependent epimerase/dehydratase family protein [Anaerolineae bacterium]
MHAFVTGATGFVGSAVVRSLLRRGIEVKVLARQSSDLRNIAGLDIEIFYGDLFDEEELTRALRGCDVLYHVAAYYSTDEADSAIMYEVNVRGTKTVMRAALRAGVQRVVHTSTIGTIGQPEDGSLATEETPFNLWDTGSHYVKSKYLGEIAALAMNDQGLSVVVVNPCAPVGPRDIKPSSTGQRIVDYLNGKMPSFVPGGINFISVHDVAEGEVLAAERGRAGEKYILGQKEGNLLLSDFLNLMEQVSGVKRPRTARHGLSIRLPMRRKASDTVPNFRPRALTCDPSKAIRDLGLPQTPLAIAFAEAVAWFRDNGYVRT